MNPGLILIATATILATITFILEKEKGWQPFIFQGPAYQGGI